MTADNGLRTKATKASKSLLKKGFIELGKGILGLAIFTGISLFGGKQVYDRIDQYNQSMRNGLFEYVDSKVHQNKIGKRDAEELKQKAGNYGININDIIHGLYNLDLDSIRKDWNIYRHPELVKTKIQTDTNYVEKERTREKSGVEMILGELNNEWNIEVVGRYHQALGELKSRGLDTGDYETKYDKIKIRNEEEAKFYQISNDLIHQIGRWCANGCDSKRVAVDAGLYFAKETRDFKPKEINLKDKARELSRYISNELTKNSGYPVQINLTKYLSTSK